MDIRPIPARSASRSRQRGAAAVEFAVVFITFFALFYAIVSYALVFMLLQGFSHAANEGARSAVAVDRLAYGSDAAYLSAGVTPRVRSTIAAALSWLPQRAYDAAVGPNGNRVEVTLTPGGAVQVAIRYQNYTSNPLIPLVSLPGVGLIPRVPQDLTGVSVIAL